MMIKLPLRPPRGFLHSVRLKRARQLLGFLKLGCSARSPCMLKMAIRAAFRQDSCLVLPMLYEVGCSFEQRLARGANPDLDIASGVLLRGLRDQSQGGSAYRLE